MTEGTLGLLGDASYGLYVHLSIASYGVAFITTPAYIASDFNTYVPLTCTVDASTLLTSCATTTGVNKTLICGNLLYIAKPSYTPGGCSVAHLKAIAI